jgi:hypothetical protein
MRSRYSGVMRMAPSGRVTHEPVQATSVLVLLHSLKKCTAATAGEPSWYTYSGEPLSPPDASHEWCTTRFQPSPSSDSYSPTLQSLVLPYWWLALHGLGTSMRGWPLDVAEQAG